LEVYFWSQTWQRGFSLLVVTVGGFVVENLEVRFVLVQIFHGVVVQDLEIWIILVVVVIVLNFVVDGNVVLFELFAAVDGVCRHYADTGDSFASLLCTQK